MTALNLHPRTNYYKIPKGEVGFSRLIRTGVYEGIRMLGNCPEFTLTVETENYQHINSQGGLSVVDLDIPIRVTRSSNITVDNMDIENQALWLGAAISEFTQSTTPVTDEAFAVRAERVYRLGESQNLTGVRNVSAVSATVGGTTRANSTAVTRGQVLLPATPNDHAYLVTVSGTTDAAPPTFPTNGTTVTDGGATLLDLGVVTSLAADTDYVVDTAVGLLSIPLAGKIGAAARKAEVALGADREDWDGLPILVDYTPGANTRIQIRAGEASSKRGRLVFFADSSYGENQDVMIPDCTIAPAGVQTFTSVASEAAPVELAVGISLLNSTTPPVIIETRGS